MSRRIARISARMALRTRTVSVGLKARLCSSARCRQCGRRISEPTPWADFDFGFAPAASDGARPPLRSSHLASFRHSLSSVTIRH